MKEKSRVRMIYVATAVAVLAMAGGYVMAAVLTSTSVTQTANFYQGGNTGVNGYATPTLSPSAVPTGFSGCTTSGVIGSAVGGTTTLLLSATSGATNCTGGNFAEKFTFAFSATIAAQTNTITVMTEVGSGPVQSNSATVTLGTGISSPFTQTVVVYVDYGAVAPPTSGITVLDAIVQ
jgi:outer membrane protein assembly factor BamA